MSQEVELKLQIAKKDVPIFFDLKCLSSGNMEKFQLKNTYYDTEDTSLAKNKIALRVRQKGKRFIQTLKTKGENQGGLHVRNEYEYELTRDELDLSLISDVLSEYVPKAQITKENLKGTFCTDFERTQIQLKDIEVVLDQGKVKYAQLTDEICEIELELKATDAESIKVKTQLLFDLAFEISKHISVMPSDISKALRGERLKGLTLNQEYEVEVAKPALYEIKDQLVYLLELTQSNWEAFTFNKNLKFIERSINSLEQLKELLLNNIELKKCAADIDYIVKSWSQLLDKPVDEILFDVQQDKVIGQILLNISRACHIGNDL